MQLSKDKIKESFPYISVIEDGNGDEYVGIIIAYNKNTISFIDINKIKNKQTMLELLGLCKNWWWYSNRIIPINLYYYEQSLPYMKYLTHLPAKTSTVIIGNIYSLEKVLEINKTSKSNKTLKVID